MKSYIVNSLSAEERELIRKLRQHDKMVQRRIINRVLRTGRKKKKQ